MIKLTPEELEAIRKEAEALYPQGIAVGDIDLKPLVVDTHIAAVTAERERAKVLVDALNEWATAKDEFDSGYSNKSGTMTRVNIAALSSAMQGAEKRLYIAFKKYNQ